MEASPPAWLETPLQQRWHEARSGDAGWHAEAVQPLRRQSRQGCCSRDLQRSCWTRSPSRWCRYVLSGKRTLLLTGELGGKWVINWAALIKRSHDTPFLACVEICYETIAAKPLLNMFCKSSHSRWSSHRPAHHSVPRASSPPHPQISHLACFAQRSWPGWPTRHPSSQGQRTPGGAGGHVTRHANFSEYPAAKPTCGAASWPLSTKQSCASKRAGTGWPAEGRRKQRFSSSEACRGSRRQSCSSGQIAVPTGRAAIAVLGFRHLTPLFTNLGTQCPQQTAAGGFVVPGDLCRDTRATSSPLPDGATILVAVLPAESLQPVSPTHTELTSNKETTKYKAVLVLGMWNSLCKPTFSSCSVNICYLSYSYLWYPKSCYFIPLILIKNKHYMIIF